ncbi:MAG: thioredoxin domain-containing protein [Myxococcota bacterium]|jgi:uncharacterized protein YyaL (SSP411 family)|nr:thioredoxin domain-containing protein [Myxococcota bacterium]
MATGRSDEESGAKRHGAPAGSGNRLRTARSAYLRQHGDNPVDWYPWGEEALRRAREEDRPVFLSIGYASCHWCHVMEREVFEDPQVAEVLNRWFVSIKVDREERPDLDAAYMDAVVAMTGSGGWPLSLFLTPGLLPFFGATYVPREQFLALASRVHTLFAEQRDQLEQQAAQVVAALQPVDPGSPRSVPPELLGQAAAAAKRSLDARWGGFTGRMKFPSAPRLTFLLRLHRRTGDPELAELLRTTLRAMASGGIHDQLGGGFHRYAVDPRWEVPHFEKMLYDNALLASLYLEAGVALEEADFLRVGEETLDFLLTTLANASGGFGASLDADSLGGEGAYYTWRPAELTRLAGPRDGEALALIFGVTAPGNHEGRSVPTRRIPLVEASRRLGRPVDELATLVAEWRGRLVRERSSRPAPAFDRKVITSWNGLTLAALSRGALLPGGRRYQEAAADLAEFLWDHHRNTAGELLRVSQDGAAEGAAVLEDHAFFAEGLLLLYQASGEVRYLQRALQLAQQAVADHGGPGPGYAMARRDQAQPLGPRADLHDGATPSGSATLVRILVLLAALTGRDELRREAADRLAAVAPLLARSPLDLAGWLEVALLLDGPLRQVVVAGDPTAPATAALLAAARGLLASHVVVLAVPASGPGEALRALCPASAGKGARPEEVLAFVCEHGTCRQPTRDPAELRRQLLAGHHG